MPTLHVTSNVPFTADAFEVLQALSTAVAQATGKPEKVTFFYYI